MSFRHFALAGAILALVTVAFTPPLAAQPADAGPVVWYYEVEVATEDTPEFEAAMEEWAVRLDEDRETWTWNVMQSVTGPARYVIMTPFHEYADFDRDPIVDEGRMEANQEWFDDNLAPYVRSARSVMMELRPELSIAVPESDGPPPMWSVLEWRVLSNSTETYLELTNAFTKVRDAFAGMNEQAVAAGEDPGGYNIFQVMYDDDPLRMLAAFPMEEFGDLGGGDPLEFFTVMSETYGHQDAVALERVFDTRMEVVRNNLWVHRMDLSHMPDGGM